MKNFKKYIEKTSLNCLISSGPPHSMHLVGLKLKKTTNLKWIADFRDPWTGIEYFEKLKNLDDLTKDKKKIDIKKRKKTYRKSKFYKKTK